MKKKLLVGLLASSMILGLTACGDSGKGGGEYRPRRKHAG